ncbi:MAG: DNA polymerase III subunit gamma/tau [bacterium]
MSSTLYRKYRPQGWSQVAGQEHVKETLAFEVSSGRTVHAYLFSGPRGVGKTTTARILAKAVNCLDRAEGSGEPCGECEACRSVTEGGSLDIIEIDAASNRGIDSVRDNIIENARFSPVRLRNKVFIIDEVHMLTTEAFNALLKTLEEPPENVIFLLATTELHKVPATIISRCQRFDFRKIPVEAVVERLAGIAASESIEIDREVLVEIARRSEGCLRDAEGLLGKVLSSVEGDRVTVESVQVVLPRSDWETAASFVEALLSGDTAAALSTVGGLLDSGAEPEQLAGETLEMLRRVLVVKVSGDSSFLRAELDESRLERVVGWTGRTSVGSLVRSLEILLEKRRDMKGSPLPQLPLELAAVLICRETSGEGRPQAARSEASAPSAAPRPPSPPRAAVAVQQQASPAPAVTAEAGGSQPAVTGPDAAAVEVADSPSADQPSSADEPVPPVATEPESTVPDSAPSVEIESVVARWGEIVKAIGEASQSLYMLMSAVSPVRVDGRTVELGSCFPFYRDRLNEDKTRRILEGAFSSVFGPGLLVRAITLEKNPEVGHNDVAAEVPVAPAKVEAPTGVQKIADAFGGRVVG